MSTYSLERLPGSYAVCQLPPEAAIPAWAANGAFCSITRTGDELSIICPEEALPSHLPTEMTIASHWVLLRVEGSFNFEVTGVLATLSMQLAQAGVVILAVATYRTDYLLVKAEQLDQALAALTAAGHQLFLTS